MLMLTERKWRMETVPPLVGGIFFSIALGSLLAQLLGLGDAANTSDSAGFVRMLLSTLFFQFMILVLVRVFLRINEMSWSDAFGFKQCSWVQCVKLALGTFVFVLPLAWTLGRVSSILIEKAGEKPVVQYAVKIMQEQQMPLINVVWMGFSTILLAPLTEELMFRGVLYPTIKQVGYPRLAFWGTTIFFAAFHANLMTLVPLFMLAITLTWLYERTDNLLAPILLHSFFNAANFLALVLQWDLGAWWNRMIKWFP